MMKRKYRSWLVAALVLNILVIIGYGIYYYRGSLPEEIRIITGKEERISFLLPFSAKIEGEGDSLGVVEVNKEPLEKGSIKIDLSDSVIMEASEKANLKLKMKLFGIIPLKTVEISAVTPQSVAVGGSAIGIHVETDGVLVLGTTSVTGEDKMTYEPAENRLKSGDYIEKVNGKEIKNKEDLIKLLKKSDGSPLQFTVRRGNEKIRVAVTPVRTTDGTYKIGTWIRDDTQGIGTLTYITPDGKFGALGHGITDVDTGVLIEVCGGSAYDAEILRIVKGEPGTPGELSGVIHRSEEECFGTVKKNTAQGIFGTVKDNCKLSLGRDVMEIGLKQEVKKGKASIMCEINGSINTYEIEIQQIDYSNRNHAKGLVIKITDEELINLTGGIVQGMSGSPIIQNGKLIGAVTHVFIRDSTKGYGTFIENMIDN
ncbi:MAG: SpoIVB peptidase [Lachnospiraceae bacterium]|nr:SpoIVB peptidase [Lachnospiraceae bacterium]